MNCIPGLLKSSNWLRLSSSGSASK